MANVVPFLAAAFFRGAVAVFASGFTGNTVVEYGVGCVEIDDVSTPFPTSDDADKWKVQGRGGSKPDNRKQVFKTVPSKKLVSFKANASPPSEFHVPGKAVIIKIAKPAWINSLVKKDNPKIKKSRRRQKKSM